MTCSVCAHCWTSEQDFFSQLILGSLFLAAVSSNLLLFVPCCINVVPCLPGHDDPAVPSRTTSTTYFRNHEIFSPNSFAIQMHGLMNIHRHYS
jgi:hypothetical protein